MMLPLRIIDLGRKDYAATLELQRGLCAERASPDHGLDDLSGRMGMAGDVEGSRLGKLERRHREGVARAGVSFDHQLGAVRDQQVLVERTPPHDRVIQAGMIRQDQAEHPAEMIRGVLESCGHGVVHG